MPEYVKVVLAIINEVFGPTDDSSFFHCPGDEDMREGWQYDGGMEGWSCWISAPFTNCLNADAAHVSIDAPYGASWDYSGNISNWQDEQWVAEVKAELTYRRDIPMCAVCHEDSEDHTHCPVCDARLGNDAMTCRWCKE